ncbi:hypothetical protein SALBM217S_06339 [Streptomyces griseoloalbus]
MGGRSGEQHGSAPRRSQVRGTGGRVARRRGGDPDRTGRPARRTARHEGAPHPAATGPDTDRSLVLRRPLRPRRGPGVGGMDVAPHPHIGLQTVSWLFSGEIEHRDSLGSQAFVRPGEVNLMTGGRGISHSEVSTPDTAILHGVQLWVALPSEHRDTAPDFQHHVPAPGRPGRRRGARLPRLTRRGHLTGRDLHTPARRRGDPGPGRRQVTLDVDPGFEHGVLVDSGDVRLDGTAVRPAELAYTAPGRRTLTLTNAAPRGRPAAGAGGSALPGGDRHVVELHRTHPRRDRGRPGGLGERLRALRPGRGLPAATASRRPYSPTPPSPRAESEAVGASCGVTRARRSSRSPRRSPSAGSRARNVPGRQR